MTKRVTKPLLVFAAIAMPVTAMTISTPAMAQSASAQSIAENLLSAINGPMAERNSWARENLLQDNLYSSRVDQLKTIALRTDGLELVGVDEVEGGMYVNVRDARGRNSRIVVALDADFPGKVRGLSLERL